MDYFSSSFKLGILGGGQLGKMLLYETRKYDIYTCVLDPSAEAPCRIAANEFVQGDLMDEQAVYQFGQKVDVLTIEIEHVNIKALERLEKEGKKVYPSVETLSRIQNKAVQKKFYQDHQIPTSAYHYFEGTPKDLTYPCVWKATQFGYDGFGVKVLKAAADLDVLPDEECIVEELVPFVHEIAVIVARNTKGEIAVYPAVEMEFHPTANQVEYVLCPARIPAEIAQKATAIARQVAAVFQHVGLLAVEMFVTDTGDILVNEVAPRPHNSGHYSIEASYTNQFEQHLRAILGLPLGATDSKASAVMVNLVGEETHSGDVQYQNIEDVLSQKGAIVHIYGKKQTRPFRKMGHITVVNQNIEQARATAQRVKESIKVISK